MNVCNLHPCERAFWKVCMYREGLLEGVHVQRGGHRVHVQPSPLRVPLSLTVKAAYAYPMLKGHMDSVASSLYMHTFQKALSDQS